jgi:hypothetical protein
VATWQKAVEIVLRFPGVEEAISYGEPSLKVRKSLLACWRKADNSIVLDQVSLEMFLAHRWRNVAPKKLIRQHDAK